MGIPVMVLGESGSGKSYSIRGFRKERVGIFLVEKPRLPFKMEFDVVRNATYQTILRGIAEAKRKSWVIDDSQYLLVNEFFNRATEVGYQKFTDIALNFRNLIHFVNAKAPDDVIVYFLHHTQTDENGRLKAKTIGKMLDEKLTVEGCFDVVLRTEVNQDGHFFRTQSNGADTVKTPEGMFDAELIPNDLAAVDKAIREYYGLEVKEEKKK